MTPAASSSGSVGTPNVLRLDRSILRRCPNAAAVTRSRIAFAAGGGGLVRCRARRTRAPVPLDRDDAAGVRFEERARQPARPRTDLDHVDTIERPGCARDAPRHIQVEDEVLT